MTTTQQQADLKTKPDGGQAATSVTVTLSRPLEHNGKSWSVLTFREAEFGDMMVADQFSGDNSKTAAVLASMCNVPLPAFRKLPMRDANKVLTATRGLMGNEPEPATTGD